MMANPEDARPAASPKAAAVAAPPKPAAKAPAGKSPAGPATGKPPENKFKCPCHGSGYTPEGVNFEGPAPRPMDRAHVELDATGQVVVDTSRLFSWFKSQGGPDHFEDPGAYITV